MVVGILLGLMAIFVATIGMKCMKCLEDNEVQKMRMAVIGGVIFLISGKRGPIPLPKLSLVWFHLPNIWRHRNFKSSWISHSQTGTKWKLEICAHRRPVYSFRFQVPTGFLEPVSSSGEGSYLLASKHYRTILCNSEKVCGISTNDMWHRWGVVRESTRNVRIIQVCEEWDWDYWRKMRTSF